MGKKTSIHICTAKYGAEKHNRREKEMKHIQREFSTFIPSLQPFCVLWCAARLFLTEIR